MVVETAYYDLLDVLPSASTDEIKRAYKKQAVKHHPDKNPGNREEAERMFKRIGEAYQVLVDPDKRAIYDQYGEKGFQTGGPGDVGDDGGVVVLVDPFDLFAAIFGASMGGSRHGKFGSGGGASLFDLMFGMDDLFGSSSFGAGPTGGASFVTMSTSTNRGGQTVTETTRVENGRTFTERKVTQTDPRTGRTTVTIETTGGPPRQPLEDRDFGFSQHSRGFSQHQRPQPASPQTRTHAAPQPASPQTRTQAAFQARPPFHDRQYGYQQPAEAYRTQSTAQPQAQTQAPTRAQPSPFQEAGPSWNSHAAYAQPAPAYNRYSGPAYAPTAPFQPAEQPIPQPVAAPHPSYHGVPGATGAYAPYGSPYGVPPTTYSVPPPGVYSGYAPRRW